MSDKSLREAVEALAVQYEKGEGAFVTPEAEVASRIRSILAVPEPSREELREKLAQWVMKDQDYSGEPTEWMYKKADDILALFPVHSKGGLRERAIGGMREVWGCKCGYVKGESQPSGRMRCPHGHGLLHRMVLSWTTYPIAALSPAPEIDMSGPDGPIADTSDGYRQDYDEDVPIALASAKPVEIEPDWESMYRRLLWINHGCPISILYGDDEEMQCSGDHGSLDFKRDEINSLLARLSTWQMERVESLMKPKEFSIHTSPDCPACKDVLAHAKPPAQCSCVPPLGIDPDPKCPIHGKPPAPKRWRCKGCGQRWFGKHPGRHKVIGGHDEIPDECCGPVEEVGE